MKNAKTHLGYDHEDQVHDTDRICPYCGSSYQVEAEDYGEEVRAEECDECGKKYFARESFSITCHAIPDCELNGEAHKWAPEKVTGGAHDFCSVCGKCKPAWGGRAHD